ncbi:AP-4 complex accessory subunit Tepsin isoform X3 [Callorhinchus milii]|uniref:AP-4 complex accessory subunit Tepsin isoform X3 n=1 Tax=Callorhinchus milii TaxID=7868 RepID=UPI001C3F812C|nr:AP-4 complex accessory subunit Tepsin isoform X3 [Callorhinchus milii]
MATLGDRLGFVQRLPMLMKATSDDEVPCPGYLFEEVAKISHESVGSCQCLLEYLLERLQNNSCHVKLKVLKILRHMCSHGSPQFTLELRRNVTLIQEVTVFSGPPDLLHGNALYQKVRRTAEDVTGALFTDAVPYRSSSSSPPSRSHLQPGMGSRPLSGSTMQGFGYTAGKFASVSAGEAIISKIQRAAEAVANAVLPLHEHPINQRNGYHGEGYQPVLPASSEGAEVKPVLKSPVAVRVVKVVHHQPGLPGGGWEEGDSGHSSQDSSQTNYISDGSNSKVGTDSQSGGSRESGDLMERVEAVNLSDCTREITLVNSLSQGTTVFLTRDEMQHFVKECGLLNCEVVVELLNQKLKDPSETVKMILRQFQALSGTKSMTRVEPSEVDVSISSDGTSHNVETPLMDFSSVQLQLPVSKTTSVFEENQELTCCLLGTSQEKSVPQEDQRTITLPLSVSEIECEHKENGINCSSCAEDIEKNDLLSETNLLNPRLLLLATEERLHDEQQDRVTGDARLHAPQCYSEHASGGVPMDNNASLFADMVLVQQGIPASLSKPCLNQGLARPLSSREMYTLTQEHRVKQTEINSTVKLLDSNTEQTTRSEFNQHSVFSFLNASS